MKAENLTKAHASFEAFLKQLRASHTDAVAIQHRQKAVEEMQRQGRRASEIAEYLRIPLPTVEKMLEQPDSRNQQNPQ